MKFTIAFFLFLSITGSVLGIITECKDIANWKDVYGDGCDWYAAKPESCDLFGDCCEKNGYTANTACCECGGGEYIEIVAPTPAPKGMQLMNMIDISLILLMFIVMQ